MIQLKEKLITGKATTWKDAIQEMHKIMFDVTDIVAC